MLSVSKLKGGLNEFFAVRLAIFPFGVEFGNTTLSSTTVSNAADDNIFSSILGISVGSAFKRASITDGSAGVFPSIFVTSVG